MNIYASIFSYLDSPPSVYCSQHNNKSAKIIRDVTVKIMDSGVGISKADLETLFSAYSQVRPEQLQQGTYARTCGVNEWSSAVL